MAIETYGRIGNIAITKDPTSKDKKIYGFAYPLVKGNNHLAGGYFRKESGKSLVLNNLQQLLRTRKGERIMVPDFGTNIYNYLFSPITEDIFLEIKDDIFDAVSKYAPNVQILKLSVNPIDKVSVEGGQGIKISLQVKVAELNNQIIDVPVTIG